MSVEDKIKDVIELFGNYMPSPLIYSTPCFTFSFPRPKRQKYSDKCDFCRFLLVRCDKCVKKIYTYDLLDKFKGWMHRADYGDEDIIWTWLAIVTEQKCNEILGYAKELQNEINEWKNAQNGNKNQINNYLKWIRNSDVVYQKSLNVIKHWLTTQENKNDLQEFMAWLKSERPDDYKKFEIYLNEWTSELYNHRNLCNIKSVAYHKVKFQREFEKLLFDCRKFPVTYVPMKNIKNMEEYKDSTDGILIIKL